MTPEEHSSNSRLGAYVSWANTEDRSARTRKARNAFDARFERQVDPDGVMSPADRAKAADAARHAYFAELSRRGRAAKRLNKSAARRESDAA